MTNPISLHQGLLKNQFNMNFLLENIQDMVFIVDRSANVLWANQRAQKYLRGSLSQCLHRPFGEYFPCKNPEFFHAKVQEVHQYKTEISFEEEFSEGFLKVAIAPCSSGIMMICQDITLTRNSDMLARASTEKKQEFISTLSHEFRTPLAALVLQNGMAKKLFEGKKLSEERMKTFFNQTQKDLGRLTRLVEDMMDVLKLSEQELPLHPEFYELEEELENVVEDFRPELKQRNIPLQCSLNAPVIVNWDRKRMKQVMAQLISNAIAYGDGSPILIDAKTGGGHVYFSILNQGAVIPKEKQRKIFECFERGIQNRETSGLGIGLFIARKILHLHRGDIKLTSSPGKGTIFEMSIPITPQFPEKSS